MKIAFDIQPLLDSQKSGIGYYQYGLVKNIIKRYPDDEYVLNFFNNRLNIRKIEEKIKDLKKDNVMTSNFKWFNSGFYKLIWNILPIQYSWLFDDKVDITHFFNYFIPPGVKGKKIVTVHDMTYKRFPETVRLKTRRMLELNLQRSINIADAVITISEFSKNEILTYFPECEDKITVVYCGVDINRFTNQINNKLIEKIKQKYMIDGEYLLYLGTLEPRKNIRSLIESYGLVIQELERKVKLVIAGGKGWMYNDIFEKIKELRLEKDVIFTGYIDDEDIGALMKGAVIFLFPSMYEGFGMPTIEAMACGTPVLTSKIASLPEITGDSALLVNPFSVNDIKYGMLKLLTDKHLRDELSIKGLERSKRFSYESISKDLYNVYETVMKR